MQYDKDKRLNSLNSQQKTGANNYLRPNPYIKLVNKLKITDNGISKPKSSDVHLYNSLKHGQFNKT